MAYEKPLPKVNADTERFWEGSRTHELRFQRCGSCGHVRFPPSVLCPQCHARDMTWITAAGTGKIYTYAIYHVAYYPGFLGEIPYVVAVVELDEGPRMLTNIVGCPPSDVYCEMPVQVSWEDVTPEISLPKFTPRL
ncbi:MAG: Zn-ribbon domain-containing OB-fold protein [Desulfomonilia bacterium]|nr:Zn-ribbon domain-containing OB-fold protein [Desulfomonilia bacterium]